MIDLNPIKSELIESLEMLKNIQAGVPLPYGSNLGGDQRHDCPECGLTLTRLAHRDYKVFCDRIGMLLLMLPKGETICLP